jgi:hypothetical protein
MLRGAGAHPSQIRLLTSDLAAWGVVRAWPHDVGTFVRRPEYPADLLGRSFHFVLNGRSNAPRFLKKWVPCDFLIFRLMRFRLKLLGQLPE